MEGLTGIYSAAAAAPNVSAASALLAIIYAAIAVGAGIALIVMASSMNRDSGKLSF